jgi:hypothetical protein
MGNEVDRELSSKYCVRFAELAVKKGYVDPVKAKEAMSEQVDDDLNNRPHRLIGRILMDRGWMSPQDIESVLKELFQFERV